MPGSPGEPNRYSASKDNQPSGQGLHKQLRKTKYCIFHIQGVCHFGDACAFAHTLEELQGVPDLKKTKLCRFKSCKDANCPFAHSEKELRSTDLCYKKTLCMWHQKGRCRNGEQCRFAHGKEELKSQRERRRQVTVAERQGTPSLSHPRSSSSSSQAASPAHAFSPVPVQTSLPPQLEQILQTFPNMAEPLNLQGLHQLLAQMQPSVSAAPYAGTESQAMQVWIDDLSQQMQTLSQQLETLEMVTRSAHLGAARDQLPVMGQMGSARPSAEYLLEALSQWASQGNLQAEAPPEFARGFR